MATSNVVPKIYRGVIEDVIKNVRESFLNEGVDEQVLHELKQIWESKLLQSRAVDGMPAEGQQTQRQQYMYPHVASTIPQQAQPTKAAHQVNIAPAAVRVPEAVTPQQAASGQTAILYPSAHSHALGQMTAAASAATMAIPENLSQLQQGVSSHAYPTVRTIQATQQVGNLQRIVNTAQPRHIIGTTQQQVIHHQPTMVGNTQLIRTAQPSTTRVTQPQVIQMTQLQAGDNKPPGIQVIQVDGANDSDSEDDDDDDDDEDDLEDDKKDKSQEGLDEADLDEEDPLNSDDDVSDDDPTDLFDTDNVVVCQFDKITRTRNKWKFHLKDGIMNLRGRDYVFQKATGDAEW